MSDDKYYIISVDYIYDGRGSNDALSMPELPEDDEDDWMFGQPFTVEPEQRRFRETLASGWACRPREALFIGGWHYCFCICRGS